MKKFYTPAVWVLIMSFLPVSAAFAKIESAIDPRAEMAFLEGKYDKVVNETTKLIDDRSSRPDELYYARGLANLRLRSYDDARNDFKYILTKYPNSGRAFNASVGVGDSYFLNNDFSIAAKCYEDTLAKFRSHKDLVSVYYKMADCYRSAGNISRGDYYFEKARKLSPLSFEARMAGTRTAAPAPVKHSIFQAGTQSSTRQGGNYSVQVGSFKSKDNADRLSGKLARQGYANYIEYNAASGSGMYRVKVGRFDSRGEAENQACILKSRG